MDEQEYQDKLKVRSQLSVADKLRVTEHEFELLTQKLEDIQITLADLHVKLEVKIKEIWKHLNG